MVLDVFYATIKTNDNFYHRETPFLSLPTSIFNIRICDKVFNFFSQEKKFWNNQPPEIFCSKCFLPGIHEREFYFKIDVAWKIRERVGKKGFSG